jgi:SAM-dependent methyltransferase
MIAAAEEPHGLDRLPTADPSTPRCPITGLPATRRIQGISSRLLAGLWRASFGVDALQLREVERFTLWESACGLAFFDPMLAGDDRFYTDLYSRLDAHEKLASAGVHRPEFERAADLVRTGDRVLDVGCGAGGFSRYLRHAVYTGLELHSAINPPAANILNETISSHAARMNESYDVVCAFQVVEHVSDPFLFASDMTSCIKPGGLLVLGVPCWPSRMTDIPNFVLNAPPHHLSWWSRAALEALAARLGLIVVAIQDVAPGSHSSIVFWMGRVAPKLTGERYFRAALSWYAALTWSWLAGRVCDTVMRVPQTAAPLDLLLVARKTTECDLRGRAVENAV